MTKKKIISYIEIKASTINLDLLTINEKLKPTKIIARVNQKPQTHHSKITKLPPHSDFLPKILLARFHHHLLFISLKKVSPSKRESSASIYNTRPKRDRERAEDAAVRKEIYREALLPALPHRSCSARARVKVYLRLVGVVVVVAFLFSAVNGACTAPV